MGRYRYEDMAESVMVYGHRQWVVVLDDDREVRDAEAALTRGLFGLECGPAFLDETPQYLLAHASSLSRML
jgi:hypothetical protein